MGNRRFLLMCATICCFYVIAVLAKGARRARSRFTCRDRASGYYADMDTGCQVYHMCDALGRQFSYSCPNTTLFQQRMLVCDHWYMVNCSNSEKNYDANLLIGQRDKPFVSDEEMQALRTPRPDILSVPANENYYDGLREAESKFPAYPSNSIVGLSNSIDDDEDDDLSSNKNYRPPTSWSTGTGIRVPNTNIKNNKNQHTFERVSNNLDNIAGAASHDLDSTLERVKSRSKNIPSQEIVPPFFPIIAKAVSVEDTLEETKDPDDPLINFINRFDPESSRSLKTSMTQTQIIDINKELPGGQSSAEDEKIIPREKNPGDNFNFVEHDKKKDSRFNSIDLNIGSAQAKFTDSVDKNIVPQKILLPPKSEYSEQPGSTAGPPVYYEWKWAVPAFGLEPPALTNSTERQGRITQGRSVNGTGESPFSHVTRPPHVEIDIIPRIVEYNTSSYSVPDYVFPLDKPHLGYEDEDAKTSFMVPVKAKHSYGENPDCPECHPAFLVPGTCKPCVVNR